MSPLRWSLCTILMAAGLSLLSPVPASAQPFLFEAEQPKTGDDEDAYFFTLIEQKPYRRAWDAMMKGARRDAFWMPDPDRVTASPNLVTHLDGREYKIGRICKPHDCGNNQFLVLFAPDARQAWGMRVTRQTDVRWFGDPGPLQKDILRAAYRSQL